MQPFAWAGLVMSVPDAFRPIRIRGDAARGSIDLGDDRRSRLEIHWGKVTKTKFDAVSFAKRQLARAAEVGRSERRSLAFDVIEHDTLATLLAYHDDDKELDRFVGFDAASRRVIELAYHRANEREDHAVRDETIARLTVTPPDRPQPWAFFDVRFMSPAHFKYRGATLNLGDMTVNLNWADKGWWRPMMSVRHIYPATLALSRQPIDQWMRTTITGRQLPYRAAQRFTRSRKPAPFEQIDTPYGPAIVVDARLRLSYRVFQWRLPGVQRTCIAHDEEHDRLVVIQVADRRDRLENRCAFVLKHTPQRNIQ